MNKKEYKALSIETLSEPQFIQAHTRDTGRSSGRSIEYCRANPIKIKAVIHYQVYV